MTVIENAWDPVPVDAERAERNRRRLITDMRRRDPGWQWNGPQIPENMPAYDNLYGGNDGRVLVLRTADTERLSDCDPDILAP